MPINPEDLTINQLKEELISHGVTLPGARSLKHVYVDLYNKHIVKAKREFSSDDSEVYQGPAKRISRVARRKRANISAIPEDVEAVEELVAESKSRKLDNFKEAVSGVSSSVNNKLEEEVVREYLIGDTVKQVFSHYVSKKKTPKIADDLEKLSNQEIAAKLKSYGQEIGPIGRTTRSVYVKKLVKLLEKGDGTPEAQRQYSDEDEKVVPVEPRRSSRRRTMLLQERYVASSQKSTSSSGAAPATKQKEDVDIPIPSSATKRRPLRSSVVTPAKSTETTAEIGTTSTNDVKKVATPTKPKPAKLQRNWLPVWVQTVLTLLIIVFVYLVLKAMQDNQIWLSLPSERQSSAQSSGAQSPSSGSSDGH